jgi:hypothetical protein
MPCSNKNCDKCTHKDKHNGCKKSNCLTIIGKLGEIMPNVCHPRQGQIWLSSNYQTEYIFDKCEWHLVTLKPNCDKVLVNYIFNEHTTSEVLEDFGANVFGNDGIISIDADGLTVNSNPFKTTIPKGNEHPKWLRYWNDPFILSDDYEIYYETEIAVKQYIDVGELPNEFKSRIKNIDEDIRLCSGAINTLDLETWSVCDIFLSNEKVYCFVERLPFGQTPPPNNGTSYAAYSACVAAVKRTGDPYNDFVKVAIGLKKSGVSYYINDIHVFTVPRYGVRQLDQYTILDHQGVAEQIQVNSSFLGFGTFSLLDMQLIDNYARQLVVNDFGTNQSASGLVQLDEAKFYGETLPGQLNGDNRQIVDESVTWAVPFVENADNTKYKLFNQGSVLRMKYFKVCIRY